MARQKRRKGFRSLGYASYEEYLRSDHWQAMRQRYFASLRNKKPRCYVCEATDKPLDIHHKTYIRIGREKPSDLIPLCRECHEEVHNRQPNHWAMWNTHRNLRRKKRKEQSG